MITAVDTNVVLDVLAAGSPFAAGSALELARARTSGTMIASDPVWAELAAAFNSAAAAEAALATLEISYSSLSRAAAGAAGLAWRSYRAAGGPRARVLPDFMIGAHALHQADALLSRDRGVARRYFPELRLIDPSAG